MVDFYLRDLTDGTAQSRRYPRALQAGYFGIDEMGLEQLLVQGMRLAQNLKYVGVDDTEAGSWEDLFIDEAVVALADLASTDTAILTANYRICMAKPSITPRAETVAGLARKIDTWEKAFSGSPQTAVARLHKEVTQVIGKSLSPRLHGIDEILSVESDEAADELRDGFRRLGAEWGFQESTPDRSASGPGSAPDSASHHERQLGYVDTSFDSFIGGIDYIKGLSHDAMDASLTAGDLNPALGLYIAFLKLFARAQEEVNKFPQKRLDFYYSKILQIQPKARRPDAVNLALTPGPGRLPAVVPAGTQFLAGKDALDRDIIYASAEDMTLTDAAVQQLRAIWLDSDPLISPNNELGYVNRVLASEHSVAPQDGKGYSLFGTDASEAATDAQLGFAISSPLLHLGEGDRKIRLDLECAINLDPAGDGEQVVQEFEKIALDRALLSTSARSSEKERKREAAKLEQRFKLRLGQVLARELLSSRAWLSDEEKKRILEKARQVFAGGHVKDQTKLDVISRLLTRERSALFYEFLRGCFDVRLTGESGWLPVKNYFITPMSGKPEQSAIGLSIELSLMTGDEAVVAHDPELHGGDFTTDFPIVSLVVNADSLFYSYSLLAALDILVANLTVSVCGARKLVAWNQLGQVDASKPFYPFGPQPARDSYLAIGHHEAASKPLTTASLRIQWGGLPRNFGGFEEYYLGYLTRFTNDSFLTQTANLSNGVWSSGDLKPQQLFRTDPQTGKPAEECCLDLLQGRHFSELRGIEAETDYRLDNRSRNGFFRFDLGLCEEAFGHSQYPQILSNVLTANARRRKPLPTPQPPYTPKINRISLDYTAAARIQLRAETVEDTALPRDRLFHYYPFGTREIAQFGNDRSVPLLPQFDRDGYLLLGLTGKQLPGVVHLLFDLRNGRRQSIDQTIDCEWMYLSDNEFRALPGTAVLADSTANFTTSGIISIDLPIDISKDSTVMPAGYFWLVVAARGDLSLCPRLHGVRAGGITVYRQIDETEAEEADLQNPEDTISETVAPLPGVAGIEQYGEPYGGKPVEDRSRLITRTAERLRHKDRACQPWDYERLALERFPEIFKVKCFANMSTEYDRPAPGEVLVVVVPQLTDEKTGQAQRLLVDARKLEEVRQYLSERAPAWANITVRNPAYELVQVRCMVKLAKSRRQGQYLRDLNQLLSDFISPWRPGGNDASFGWRIRRRDIEACIGALDYVDFVTDFSMLHITRDRDQRYSLDDTARPTSAVTVSGGDKMAVQTIEVRPRFPWSLALPSRKHFIRTIDDFVEHEAQVTGVGELEVGSTLILDSGYKHG